VTPASEPAKVPLKKLTSYEGINVAFMSLILPPESAVQVPR